jgi:hypothetical protein
VHSEIELEFRNVDFYGGRKTGGPGEKPNGKTEEDMKEKGPQNYGVRIF